MQAKLIDWRDASGGEKNILTPDGWQKWRGGLLSWKESLDMQYSGWGNFGRSFLYNLKEGGSFAGRQVARVFGVALYLPVGLVHVGGLFNSEDRKEAENIRNLANNWIYGAERRSEYAKLYGSDSQLFCENPYFGPSGVFNEAMELGGKVAFGKGASIGERIVGGLISLGGVGGKVLMVYAGTKGLEGLGVSKALLLQLLGGLF